MILYLTDEDHKNNLDWIDEDVQVKVYKEPDMAIKMRKELPYMAAVRACVVEGTGIDQVTWPDAVSLLQAARQTPLLLLDDLPEEPEVWIQGDGYLLLNRAHKDIREELTKWLAGEDVLKKHTWIAVAGLTPSVGTTSLAMHLAEYIAGTGRQAAVTELSHLFPELAEAYGWQAVDDTGWIFGGVHFNSGQIEEVPYTVFDLGLIGEKQYAMMSRCEIKILVADGKPYRLHDLDKRLAELKELPGKIWLVFNFVTELEQARLKQHYSSDQVSVWFAPYAPDLLVTDARYQELLTGYVTPPETKKKKKVKNKGQPKQIRQQQVQPERRQAPDQEIPAKKQMSKNKNRKQTLKVLLLAGGSLAALFFLFGTDMIGVRLLRAMAQDYNKQETAVYVQSEQMQRLSSAKLRLEATEATTEATTEAGKTEATTEAVTTAAQQTVAATAGTTTAPATEATTAATEATTEKTITIPVRPSLSGYDGQIYTGAEVQAIMNQYAGSNVSCSVTTRDGSGTIDPACSFLCQVVYTGGEETGLHFTQQ